MDNIQNDKQTLVINNRSRLEVNGVKSINSFDEDYLEVSTNLGLLCVEGSDLKIEALDHEKGIITVVGRINGVFYKEEKGNKGFFRKKYIYCTK